MKILSGYLAPDGTFIEADAYEHVSVAERLVRELELTSDNRYDIGEDILLKHGYICFRFSDVYKRSRRDDRSVIFNTDEQIQWMCDHKREFTLDQFADVCRILLDFGGKPKFNEA